MVKICSFIKKKNPFNKKYYQRFMAQLSRFFILNLTQITIDTYFETCFEIQYKISGKSIFKG
jgi:hypothetical protein